MNVLWSKVFRALYRKEPIVGFVATVGIVDAAIGGLTQHWSLLSLGLGTVGTAVVLRWWQVQRRQSWIPSGLRSSYLLPPQSSRPSLPTLNEVKRK